MTLDVDYMQLLDILAEDSSVVTSRTLDLYERGCVLGLMSVGYIRCSVTLSGDSIQDVVLTDEGKAALAAYKLRKMK
jgi:hypothetical protein